MVSKDGLSDFIFCLESTENIVFLVSKYGLLLTFVLFSIAKVCLRVHAKFKPAFSENIVNTTSGHSTICLTSQSLALKLRFHEMFLRNR